MYNRGIFQKPIVLTIGAARQLWKANEKNPGSIPNYIINTMELSFGRQDLDFQPQRGDILESKSSIVMFDGFTDWGDEGAGRGVKIFFSYNKQTNKMSKITQPDLIEIINGYENDYVYATNENKKLFYENMSNL